MSNRDDRTKGPKPFLKPAELDNSSSADEASHPSSPNTLPRDTREDVHTANGARSLGESTKDATDFPVDE